MFSLVTPGSRLYIDLKRVRLGVLSAIMTQLTHEMGFRIYAYHVTGRFYADAMINNKEASIVSLSDVERNIQASCYAK